MRLLYHYILYVSFRLWVNSIGIENFFEMLKTCYCKVSISVWLHVLTDQGFYNSFFKILSMLIYFISILLFLMSLGTRKEERCSPLPPLPSPSSLLFLFFFFFFPLLLLSYAPLCFYFHPFHEVCCESILLDVEEFRKEEWIHILFSQKMIYRL